MTLVLRPVQSHIISISGRAGTGKSAMAKGLLKKFGRYAKMVPSYMTREKRPNEKEGFDGVFITHAEFEALIEKGAFTSPNGTALWVEQGGNYYGRRADDFLHSGVSIIDVSYSGLELMRKAFPDQVYAVLIRSNMSDERNREILEARGVHEPEEIERRVRIGRQMMQPEVYEPLNFNFITANRRGELDKNVAMVAAEFRKWRDAAAVKDNPPLLKMGTPLLHKPSGGKYIVKETEVDDDGTWFVLEDDSGSRQFVSEEELLQMYTQYPTSPEWRANPPEDISVEPMSTTPIHYAVMMDEYHELREKSNRTRGEDKRLQYLKSFLDALGVHTDFRTNPPGVPKPGKELSKERKREIRKKWLELVNMTQSELQAFYDSEWGNDKAGLSREEAREQGISSGRDSALAILKMKETPVREWHKKRSKDRGRGIMLDFWQWAQKQINFNTRHRAMQGAYLDDKGRPKRKLLGLWIWGHDPWRYAMKVEPEQMPTAPDVVWVGRKEKEHFGVGPVGGVHANPPAETVQDVWAKEAKEPSKPFNIKTEAAEFARVDPWICQGWSVCVDATYGFHDFLKSRYDPMPEELKDWKIVWGGYHEPGATYPGIDKDPFHVYIRHKDGRIIDFTADQFGTGHSAPFYPNKEQRKWYTQWDGNYGDLFAGRHWVANPPEDSATMLTGFQTDGKGSSYNLLRSNGQTIPVDPATKPNGEHPVFGKRYAKKFSRQDHPAFSPLPFEARRWKKSTFKTGAETDIDSWKGKIDDSMGATVTLKIDGEGTVAHFDGNETVLWNWYDRWRTGFHITDVLTKRLKSRQQIKSAKIMGELFAVDADGNMLPMTGGGTDANGRSETSSSIIKSPQTMERQQRIRWLAFDILEVDGQDYSDRPFDERLSKLVSMLGRSMVVPHIKARGPSSQVPASKALETAWREWGHDPEFEGAVLHLFRRQTNDEPIGVYKVKGAATADMVVMGGYWGSSAEKDGNKGTFADMVGGLAVGWMMPNGDFVYSGNVGTGFNFSQREDLVKVIRKHGVKADTPSRWGSHILGAPRGRKQEDDGNGKMVAIDPHSAGLIVEVEYRGLNWSERPVYRFQDSVMYQVGTIRAPTLFQPSFKRFREDKSVSPDDLRMSQVAGEGEGKWTTRPEAHGAARRNPIPKGMRKLEGKERPTGPFYHGTSMRLAKKYMEKGKEDKLMFWGAAGIMKGEGQLHESHERPNAVMGMFVTKTASGTNSAMSYAKGAAMMEYHWEDNDEATPVVLEVLPDGLDFYSVPNTAAYQSDPNETFIVVTKGYDGNSPDTIPPENLRIAYVDEEFDPWAPPWDEDYGSSRPFPTGRHGAARKKKQKGSNRICPHPEKVKFSTMAEADAAIPIHKRGWVRSYRCPVDGPAHYHHTKNLHRNAPSKNRTRSIRDSEVQSFRIPRIRVYPGEMTPGLLRKHRDHIFLFGDNERREGKGGQAKIRDEPNAFGIRTKRAPKTNQGAYWSDENYQQNIEMMADDFRRVFREIRPGMTLVIPGSGLGTGRALLPERAPKTFEWLLFVVGSLMMMADKNPAKGGL